ncbi:MAG: L-seryl-tRNA(Sec) selenium transferase [Gemmatimonadetes bacterium]|nr:L-seryl-tRNA(Sec) selenium transferase [Gemmatimonadota bacterium]NIO30676.1 L-seryl-tRNA(Sec) selenium transferase [Gemmatimonadota bacterium]
MSDARRGLPGVDALLGSPEFGELLDAWPRSLVVASLRRTLEGFRSELAAGDRAAAPEAREIVEATHRDLAAGATPSLRHLINATGVPLHTNLGRAPLPDAARAALDAVSRGYSNLEYGLEAGSRGSRHDHCAAILAELTGADASLVVNNNAAAVVLALNELAEGREVIVSRGELVEIGETFRVAEIVAKSGARVTEVGATNRTHARDYEKAIGPETGALLKVHRSNFQQAGFVSEVSIEELTAVGHRHDVPVVHDLGSGMLPDAERAFGFPWEPSVRASLDAGADLVTFSGDKLLGGPQAGVILGGADLVARLRRNPLLRAVRVGKLTIAALEATLRLWRDLEAARTEVPALAMIGADPAALRERAERLAGVLRERCPDAEIEVAADVAEVGGGSYPGLQLETWVLRVTVPGRSERALEAACRNVQPAVIGRVREGALCLDPRTVLPGEETEFIDSVSQALRGDG